MSPSKDTRPEHEGPDLNNWYQSQVTDLGLKPIIFEWTLAKMLGLDLRVRIVTISAGPSGLNEP